MARQFKVTTTGYQTVVSLRAHDVARALAYVPRDGDAIDREMLIAHEALGHAYAERDPEHIPGDLLPMMGADYVPGRYTAWLSEDGPGDAEEWRVEPC